MAASGDAAAPAAAWGRRSRVFGFVVSLDQMPGAKTPPRRRAVVRALEKVGRVARVGFPAAPVRG
jgi:hypothetical protein